MQKKEYEEMNMDILNIDSSDIITRVIAMTVHVIHRVNVRRITSTIHNSF